MNELTIRIFKDGDQWCVLLGEDLVQGFGAFGSTVDEAIGNFWASYGEEAKAKGWPP